MLVATQNRGAIKAFEQDQSCVRVLDVPADVYRVEVLLADNKRMLRELYYGNGFISQSARQVCISKNVKSVTLTTFDGKKSSIDF
jgi:hypothetical protein